MVANPSIETARNESTDAADIDLDLDDDDDDSTTACLEEMLGGISFAGDWPTEEQDGESCIPISVGLTPGRVDPSTTKKGRNRPLPKATTTPTSDRCQRPQDKPYTETGQATVDATFQISLGNLVDHVLVENDTVNVVDFGDRIRGRGLVSIRFISKGDVIYTERALVATQVLPSKDQEPIKACQTCYRSLEAWTKLIPRKQWEMDGGNMASNLFPFPELWPVEPLDFKDDDVNDDDASSSNDNSSTRSDRHGRVQCTHCQALFCSKACYSKKIHQFGSCCFETKVRKDLPGLLREVDDEENDTQVYTPLVLAVSMFLQLVHYCRAHNVSTDGHFINRLCGTADDLCALQLGNRVNDGEDSGNYTLEHLHNYLFELADLHENEKHSFSLPLLHSLASKAARNGVGITTESPFKSYYAGLLRKANYGGRSSEAHNRHMKQLAEALGTDQFHRGMDREIEALVAPEISGIFPLTAHCNHSCNPNAQIRSQEFAEALIDVVATRDIASGEEVCISYIELGGIRWGRRTKFQRRKELQARYLFICECTVCANGDDYGPTLSES